ncbi:MAG: peptide ABC transporter substrate-binding protein [Pseudomonadota bacterium]
MYFNYILLISLLTAVMMSGCEQQNHEEKQSKTQATEARHVGYLRLALSDNVRTLDPGLIYKNVEIEVVEQLFLGLTDFDPKSYEVVPELATHWQVSSDGTVYTYKLRQDVKWTDGLPVTAHDVVWAIQRNIAKKTDSFYAFMLYVIKNAKAIHQEESLPISSLGVRAIDDYTVEFTLEQPTSYFPALTSFWIYHPLPRHVIKSDGWVNFQTNGSYQLVEWKKNQLLILKKNPDYYEADKVKIPEVHYYIVPDSSLGFAMYKKNELDIIGGQTYLPVPQSEMSNIKSNPVLRKEKRFNPQFCTEWYGFSVQQPPLDNPLVRKAIAAAIDKKTLIDIVLKANHLPAMTFTQPPVFGAVDPKATKKVGIFFDPIDAKAWLAKAGYPEGKNFPQLFLVHNGSEFHHETAKTVKTMLKHYLNINVEIRAFDFERYINILKQPTTPLIFRMVWCANYPDAHDWLHHVFHPDKGINWIGWNNREFAKVVDKAERIYDPVVRRKLYRHAEKILTEKETAIIPLYFLNTPFLVKPWVKGWYHKGFGGQHIRHWSLEN